MYSGMETYSSRRVSLRSMNQRTLGRSSHGWILDQKEIFAIAPNSPETKENSLHETSNGHEIFTADDYFSIVKYYGLPTRQLATFKRYESYVALLFNEGD